MIKVMGDEISIYTDGSSSHNPRKGGVGFKFIFPDGEEKSFCPPGYAGATNNEMELMACILSLREVLKLSDIKGAGRVTVYSDSQYVINNHTLAMFQWPKQHWLRNNGEPVLNAGLWKDLVKLIQKVGQQFKVSVFFKKVAAHSGVKDNEDVDKLAKKSRKGMTSKLPISRSNVRRGLIKTKTVKGSVRGEGAQIRIRIISGKYLREQKLYSCRFEVLSPGSKYYGNRDMLVSTEVLRGAHVYDVIFEKGLDYCRVKRIVREVERAEKRDVSEIPGDK